MNVTGPNPFPIRVPDAATPRAGRPAAAAPTSSPASAPARPAAPEATLWDLLSAEEREFFTQQAALGPLTYRPDGAPRHANAAPTGQRIDVRG